MISEPKHIISTDTISAALRPLRSAYRPISQPPMGRIKKPTAKIAAVLSSCAVVSPAGKKALAKYRENAA
ncbi:hypothetical protein D3C81_1590510 [compost metagenome]